MAALSSLKDLIMTIDNIFLSKVISAALHANGAMSIIYFWL
jgi:hypothetical protein